VAGCFTAGREFKGSASIKTEWNQWIRIGETVKEIMEHSDYYVPYFIMVNEELT